MTEPENYLGLDVGEKRIGVALVNTIARLPRPLAILSNDQGIYRKIKQIVEQENVSKLIVGLPRNMSGEETAQSKFTRQFASQLAKDVNVEINFADESLSSKRVAESNYKKDPSGYLDSIAACFILEEYLEVNN